MGVQDATGQVKVVPSKLNPETVLQVSTPKLSVTKKTKSLTAQASAISVREAQAQIFPHP